MLRQCAVVVSAMRQLQPFMSHIGKEVCSTRFGRLIATNSQRDDRIVDFEECLGYSFQNPTLLQEALTHTANERLEFLGDSVLGLCAAELVFETHKDGDEGDLTHAKKVITNNQYLASLAKNLELDRYLNINPKEYINLCEKGKETALADAMEATFGAIFLDGGYPAVAVALRRAFTDHPPSETTIVPGVTSTSPSSWKLKLFRKFDHVFTRAVSFNYELLSVEGPAHNNIFTMKLRVIVNGTVVAIGDGKGSTKKKAKESAAFGILEQLESMSVQDAYDTAVAATTAKLDPTKKLNDD